MILNKDAAVPNELHEPHDTPVTLWMTKSERTAIEDWQIANRVFSRSIAVRRIIARGLRAEEQVAEVAEIAD